MSIEYDRSMKAYCQVCLDAYDEQEVFDKFRQHPDYTRVLENTTVEQASEDLKIINKSHDGLVTKLISSILGSDCYGNGLMYGLDLGYGYQVTACPSTLRYIRILLDIERHFNFTSHLPHGHGFEGKNICEIGVGYGGQCRVITDYWPFINSYTLVDLLPPLLLANKYLDHYKTTSKLKYLTRQLLKDREYDLVISNYAFSEFTYDLQNAYLEKILLESKRGYMIYNQPKEKRGYNKEEIVEMIPGARILDEAPLTVNKCYVVIWGDSK